jgi:PAS domain S-box-containing protein
MGMLKQLLETAPDGVFVTTEDNRIVLWNRAAEAMMGYRASDVVGRACHDVLAGPGSTGTPRCVSRCDVAPALRFNGLDHSFDMATRTKTGETRWFNVSASAIADERGDGPFIVHVLRDVTSSKRLHQLIRERVGRGARARAGADPEPAARLSARELEVLRLLAAGLGTATAAQRLGVSRATIRNHVQNIFTKLDVHSRLEAVACATSRRLL